MIRTFSRRPAILLMLFAPLCLLLLSCSGSPDEENSSEAVFRIEACDDEHFLALVHDPALIQEAERLIGAEEPRIINGDLLRGDGGFNQPWSWHLDPETIQFADVTIEVCDGCPHMVQEDLNYWIDTVGRFCPWSTRVVERVR